MSYKSVFQVTREGQTTTIEREDSKFSALVEIIVTYLRLGYEVAHVKTTIRAAV